MANSQSNCVSGEGNEQWRDVSGFPGYQISNFGNLRSCRYASVGANKFRSTWHPVRPALVAGYPHVSLSIDGKRTQAYIHRMVATAFIGPPPFDKAQVNHKDGCKTNNRLNNLEWVTQSENQIHQYVVLGRKGFSSHHGERHPRAKLTQVQADEIRQKHAQGRSIRSLAREYDVTDLPISNIVKGISYRGT